MSDVTERREPGGPLKNEPDELKQVVNDLNNLMAVMRGYAQLAQQHPSHKTVGELIEVVLSSTSRAQQKIREALAEDVFPSAAPEGPGEGGEAKGAKILVVDDERLVRVLMHELLTKRGHEAVVVDSAEAALEACTKERFDIVFMDVRLPRTGGVRAFRQIRKTDPSVRVVFLSGDPEIEEIWQVVRQEGADGCVRKPFDIDEITTVISRLLATRSEPAAGAP